MKKNSFLLNPSKLNWILFALLLFFVFGNGKITAQSVVYKKDSTKIEVINLVKNDKTVTYKLLNDSAGVSHIISKSALDSIRYEDGKIEIFPSNFQRSSEEKKPEKLFKNSVGINIWPLFNSKINVYYERLFLNNKLGFKNYFLIDAGNEYYTYGSLNQMAEFYYSAGLNYYFLQSYFFRAGTGVSILSGKFNYEYWDPNNNFSVRNNETQIGVLLGVSAYYTIHKRISSSIGIQIPLGFDFPDNTIIFQTEISFNF